MDPKEINDLIKLNPLERTDSIFNSIIRRTDVHGKGPIEGEESIKKMNLAIRSGNLHVATSRVKIDALKFSHRATSMEALKKTIKSRVRKHLKYPKKG